MDILFLILGIIAIIAGLVGCILPILPGPPLSYLGLLFLEFRSDISFSWFTLIFAAVLMIAATILDYIVPVWGTKIAGGTKWGIRGCAIGLIVGLLWGIWGVLFFPFLGAFFGELLYFTRKEKQQKRKFLKALKAACGSFLGLIFGIVIKLSVSCFITFLFIKEIFSLF